MTDEESCDLGIAKQLAEIHGLTMAAEADIFNALQLAREATRKGCAESQKECCEHLREEHRRELDSCWEDAEERGYRQAERDRQNEDI